MKNILFIMAVLFAILTLVGMVYVVSSHGEVSPGISAVPMLITIGLLGLWRKKKNKC